MLKHSNNQKPTGQVECSTTDEVTKIMNSYLNNKVGLSELHEVINIKPTKLEVVVDQAQLSFTIDKLMAEVYDLKGIYEYFFFTID
jgi:hypothetical protein